jgi:hypothetical protein
LGLSQGVAIGAGLDANAKKGVNDIKVYETTIAQSWTGLLLFLLRLSFIVRASGVPQI